jgi:hypothetical protein
LTTLENIINEEYYYNENIFEMLDRLSPSKETHKKILNTQNQKI